MTGVWPWQSGPEGLNPGQKARHTDVPGALSGAAGDLHGTGPGHMDLAFRPSCVQLALGCGATPEASLLRRASQTKP